MSRAESDQQRITRCKRLRFAPSKFGSAKLLLHRQPLHTTAKYLEKKYTYDGFLLFGVSLHIFYTVKVKLMIEVVL